MKTLIQKKINLAPYTSWKVGGDADYFCLPVDKEELEKALSWASEESIEVTLLGGGTNVLVSDRGVKGLVVCFKNYVGIEDCSDESIFRVKCKAGTLKMKVMRKFLKENLQPALFLSGLPGDLAGGVVMNAGVSENVTPKEFVDIVESFKVLKTQSSTGSFIEQKYSNADIQWSYRQSQGWQPGVITEVTLAWPKPTKGSVVDVKELVRKAQELRASKQPLGEPSCGSVFRNPYDDPKNTERRSSGYLIEKVGLKGYQYGGAEISRKHANFIVNKNKATALDIHCAVAMARNKVLHEFGVHLEAEFRYLGDWGGLR